MLARQEAGVAFEATLQVRNRLLEKKWATEEELKAQGIGIFLIEHDIHNVMKLCDRAAVMKNGQMIGTERVEDVTEDDILSMIIMGAKPEKAV